MASRRVHVHHPHAEPCGGGDGAGDGVGNVVELQIEEDAIPASDEALDDGRPVAGEQTAADLEAADGAAKPVGERVRGLGGVDVKRD